MFSPPLNRNAILLKRLFSFQGSQPYQNYQTGTDKDSLSMLQKDGYKEILFFYESLSGYFQKTKRNQSPVSLLAYQMLCTLHAQATN
jgi:hypothetical protein